MEGRKKTAETGSPPSIRLGRKYEREPAVGSPYYQEIGCYRATCARPRDLNERASHWHCGKSCDWLRTKRSIPYLPRRRSSCALPSLLPDHSDFVGQAGVLASTATSPCFHGRISGGGCRCVLGLGSLHPHPRIESFHYYNHPIVCGRSLS